MKVSRAYLSKNPGDACACSFVGEVYFEWGQYDSAVYYLQKTLQLDKENTLTSCWAHIFLGRYYFVKGNSAKAREELEASINKKATEKMKEFSRYLVKVMGLDKCYDRWDIVEHDHIRYHFQDGVEELRKASFIKLQEEQFKVLTDIFKPGLSKKIDLFLWNNGDEEKKEISTSRSLVRSDILVGHTSINSVYSISQCIQYWSWGLPLKIGDRFGSIGLSSAFDTRNSDINEGAKKTAKGIYLKDVRTMWAAPEVYAEDALYNIAGAFMLYLVKHSSEEQVKSIVKNQTLANARLVYGDKFDTYAADFNKSIGLQ